MKFKLQTIFFISIASIALVLFNCKDKNQSDSGVTGNSQTSLESSETISQEDSEDSNELTVNEGELRTFKTERCKSFLKDPKCVSSPEAGLYFEDVTIRPTGPIWFVPKLSRFPWVEIIEDSATVRYMVSCSGGECYYKEAFMHPEDLADCSEVANSIVKKVNEKKPLSEILMGMKIYGSIMKSDGTSGIYYKSPNESDEDFGDMDALYKKWSYKWKSKGSSLILDRVIATEQTDVFFGDGEIECVQKERFQVIHEGGENKKYACAYNIIEKITCEITGASVSSDRKELVLKTKLLSSNPESDKNFCDASISLEGYDPYEVEYIIE
jgi:hypothetical protein